MADTTQVHDEDGNVLCHPNGAPATLDDAFEAGRLSQVQAAAALAVACYASTEALLRPHAAWMLLPLGLPLDEFVTALCAVPHEDDDEEIWRQRLDTLKARSEAARLAYLGWEASHDIRH